MIKKAAVLVFGACLAQAAFAESVYRWTDAKGQVHYGNQPPPKITQFKAVPPAPKPDKTTVVAESTAAAATPDANRRAENTAPTAELALQLQSAYAALESATQAYNRAKALRLGNERNYTTYLERIRPLEEKVQQAELRVQQVQDLAAKGNP